ncbi:hypothetical protein FHX37_4548 [Haloactinospora alba]|uniref:Uncharacterized protein n=1 Tax=Haloactinospora alba TaxID=405555 RepID=A0A543N7N9_9ACTN|nr:hypothetical protein [Haloactinospora alba]TQN27818.1 hypothetical protein FHX37_4548 [Haloactinospora alba]
MLQFIRTLASLWTLLTVLAVALFPPTRYRGRYECPVPQAAPPPPARRGTARRFTVPSPRGGTYDQTGFSCRDANNGMVPPAAFLEPEVLDPEEHSPVRPYVTQHERHRREQEKGRRCLACGAAVPAPESSAPPVYGDGLDDVRAELSPLVRQWLGQREQTTPVGVVR